MPFDQVPVKVDSHVVADLKRALALLEKGWRQGGLVYVAGDNLRFCMLGAIRWNGNNGFHISTAHYESEMVVVEAVKKLTSTPYRNIAHYNDHPTRSQQDCIAAFHVAIELQERKEAGLVI